MTKFFHIVHTYFVDIFLSLIFLSPFRPIIIMNLIMFLAVRPCSRVFGRERAREDAEIIKTDRFPPSPWDSEKLKNLPPCILSAMKKRGKSERKKENKDGRTARWAEDEVAGSSDIIRYIARYCPIYRPISSDISSDVISKWMHCDK